MRSMRDIVCLTLTLVLVGAAGAAFAGPNGLLAIPTADIQETGTYLIEWQHDGQAGFPVDANQRFLNTQFGLHPRVEAGVDFGLTGEPETVLFNYKYAFPAGRTRLAVGTYNIGSHSKPISYIISGTRTGAGHLHLGTQVTGGKAQLLLGAHTHAGRLLLEADYTSGSENFSSAGFEYALSDQWTVQWGALFPNEGGGTQFTLHIIYVNRFARARREAAEP